MQLTQPRLPYSLDQDLLQTRLLVPTVETHRKGGVISLSVMGA
jgi:hypothetical protein